MKTTRPTESELEILQVLWESGPLTVRQVNDRLNLRRTVGYTTTLKILQIMTEKSLVTRDTSARSHVYTPVMTSGEVQSGIVEHLVRTVFKGNRWGLVMKALGEGSASREELEQIRALIEKTDTDDE